LLPPYKG